MISGRVDRHKEKFRYHIAYLEAGNKIHPIGQDPDEATTESWFGSSNTVRKDRAGLSIFHLRAKQLAQTVIAQA